MSGKNVASLVKDVSPIENAIVTRSNTLIEARYRLSLHEQKIVYQIISLIQPTDNEFFTVRFKVTELAKFCGIPEKNAQRDLIDVSKTLRSRNLVIKKDIGLPLISGWISSAEYLPGGIVEFELDRKLTPYLLGLKEQFTQMRVKDFMKFRTQYAARIYELAFQQYRFPQGRKIALDELREVLGLEPKEYPLFADLRRFVVEPAIKDINKSTPYEARFDTEKNGKKVTYLIFWLKAKTEKLADGATGDPIPSPDNETAPSQRDILKEITEIIKDEEKAREVVTQYSEGYIVANLEYTRTHAKKGKRGIANYLAGALEKNYAKYSTAAQPVKSSTRAAEGPDPNCLYCRGLGIAIDENGIGKTCQCLLRKPQYDRDKDPAINPDANWPTSGDGAKIAEALAEAFKK